MVSMLGNQVEKTAAVMILISPAGVQVYCQMTFTGCRFVLIKVPFYGTEVDGLGKIGEMEK